MNIDTDVAIVGYGPVGQTLAALLGRHAATGSASTSASRALRPAARGLLRRRDHAGLAVARHRRTRSPTTCCRSTTYDWFGADGEPILRIAHPEVGPSGWEPGYLFYQPTPRAGARPRGPRPAHRRASTSGWTAEALEQTDDHVAAAPCGDGREEARRTRPLRDRRRRRELVRPPGARASPSTTSASRSAGSSSTSGRTTSRRSRRCRRRASGATRRGRTCTPATAASTAASSSCCCPASARGLRGRGARLGAAGAVVRARPTARSCATRSTSSAAGSRRRCARAACCSPATPRTPCRRSWARGCARACATPRTSRGGSTSSCAAWPTTGCSTATRPSASPQNEWIVTLSTEMGRVSCELDPARRRRARRRAARRRGAAAARAAAAAGRHGRRRGRPLAGARAVQGLVRLGGREGRFDDVVGKAVRAAHAARRRAAPAAVADAARAHRREASWRSTSSRTSTAG